jgi:hypothetical protein
MTKPVHKGSEEARNELPSLLEDAKIKGPLNTAIAIVLSWTLIVTQYEHTKRFECPLLDDAPLGSANSPNT